ncbi:MAG: EAL domain-containing protein [Methylococcales bacterium]|nr:EAL domain-containing protein [Methylococcales bacterium]
MTKYNKNLLRFTRSLWLVLGMFVILSLSLGFYIHSEKEIGLANESRLQAFLLADELRHSSDDLTNTVRSYVATGNPIYKQHYLEIIAIREGKRPRPLSYEDVYWDFVLAGNRRPRAKGESISLLELMQQAHFTAAEFAKLAQVKHNSDQLIRDEFATMALIEATQPLTDDNRRKAIELLYSPTYFQAKANMMQPIGKFNLMIEQRTLKTVRSAESTSTLLWILFIVFGFLLLLTLVLADRALYAVLGCSVDQLQLCISHFGNKDFLWANSIPTASKNSVLGWLLEKQVNLAQIEAEREQARMAQQESELKMRTIIETQPECLKLLAANGSLLQMNPAGLAIIEADSEQSVIGQNIQEIVLPKYRAAFMALTRQVFNGGSGNLEFEIRGLKGTYRWLETRAVPLRNSDGHITALLSVTRDITESKQVEQQLRDSENKLNTILDNVEAYIYIKDKDYRYQYANRLVRELFKQPLDAIIGKTDSDFFDSDTAANLHINDSRVIEQGERIAREEVNVSEDGSRCTAYLTVKQPLRFDDDTIYGLCGISTDITDRKQDEEQLRAFYELDLVGLAITSPEKGWMRINQCLCDMMEYSEQELRRMTWAELTYPDDLAANVEQFERLLANEINGYSLEKRFVSRTGKIIPTKLVVRCVRKPNSEVDYIMVMVEDITERKVAEEHINNLAFYDHLTQLANRRLLQMRIEHGIDSNHRTGNLMAVLMMDLDKFKVVNDNFGHAAGDKLLQQVAIRIKACVREVDTVARLGGDEFIILMENINHYENVARVADDIIVSLKQPFILVEHYSVTIGASIGIALYPQHGHTVETLMDNADTALYHAKASGRGCFAYFSDELTEKARERIALEARLRHAIEQQELQVYFQPQIDINSGCIIGAEALVRWHDPIHGFIMPSELIPLAEDTGLIVALGEWVLRETCRLGRQWLDQGLPAITLAVNVSEHQFSRSDINALVTQVLLESGFPVEYLELEITESGLMENQQHALSILNGLHEQGVRFAIDDFGTGYSSLAYLKYFPVDLLKIDKTFIDDIPFLAGDMAITATIIAMAHHLGFKVLAEGVETAEQLAFLREHGCDMYQGYFCSKPVPAADFATLLSTGVTQSL